MPVLQFKGKTAIECYHRMVQHHTLEFDDKPPLVDKGAERWLHDDLIIEEDHPIDTVTFRGSSGGGK